MNKQIEEIANIINEMDEPNAHYYDETLQDHEAFADCFTIARHLYSHGYRKSTDMAREIFAEIETVLYSVAHPIVRADGTVDVKRMDGFHIREEDYNAIKKKYESEGAE